MAELENIKHENFCQEYIIHFNQTKAYQAGFPESSYNTARSAACALIATHSIQQRIAELLEERAERVKITQDDVLHSIIEIRDRCMMAKPVYIKDQFGKLVESGEYQFKENGALKANELLGKHLGMFNKIEIEGSIRTEPFEAYLKRVKTEKAEKENKE